MTPKPLPSTPTEAPPASSAAGQRRDGAGGSVHGGARALEGGDQRAQSRRADPRHLRQGQIGRYLVPFRRAHLTRLSGVPTSGVGTELVATGAGRACHKVSNSGGIPCPVTAETARTGAPAWVRIVGMGDAGCERSSLVNTTTCGFAASSGE